MRDQAEQEYQLALTNYKEICTNLGHVNDLYDEKIDQYNQAIQKYIQIAYAFFEAEADWDQSIASYIYWRWQYVINYQMVPEDAEKRASADSFIKSTSDDYQNKNAIYQEKLKIFQNTYCPE